MNALVVSYIVLFAQNQHVSRQELVQLGAIGERVTRERLLRGCCASRETQRSQADPKTNAQQQGACRLG
jgi:hypothetical protein